MNFENSSGNSYSSWTNNSGNSYAYTCTNITNNFDHSFNHSNSHNGHGRASGCGLLVPLIVLALPVIGSIIFCNMITEVLR